VTKRILIVDDEEDLRDLLDFHLRHEGYQTSAAKSGAEALRSAATFHPDLVLLDVSLPDVSGVDICHRLKAAPATRDTAVVFLSARMGERDRILGLEAGADDYVTKPFSLRELLLRVAMVLGRHRTHDGELLVAGPIEIDRPRMLVRVAGAEVSLTRTELRLLTVLVEAGGRVRTRDELMARVMEAPGVETRSIDTYVTRLRNKLGPAAELLETVRSVGYRLRAE
jgi:two-component system, OmpR family, phosphate regulon response regulator PhoB